MAKTIASRAIVRTASGETAPGPLTPSSTSARASRSFAIPRRLSRLVRAASAACEASSSGSPSTSTPCRSQTITSPTPCASMISVQATPAAPAPTTTTVMSSTRLPTIRSELSSAASTTIAVPCWSSWKTGMSSSARSRRSISKQRGAAMSSRLMPPKAGAACLTKVTISSASLVSMHSGNASMPANSLKSIALPSITGIAESEHRRAVGHDRDSVALDRERPGLGRVVVDRAAHAGDAGRVGHREVVARADRDLRRDLDLASLVEQERAVGDAVDAHAVDRAHHLHDRLRVPGVRAGDGEVADHGVALDAHEVDRPEHPGRLRDRLRHGGEGIALLREPQPHREGIGGGRLELHPAWNLARRRVSRTGRSGSFEHGPP